MSAFPPEPDPVGELADWLRLKLPRLTAQVGDKLPKLTRQVGESLCVLGLSADRLANHLAERLGRRDK